MALRAKKPVPVEDRMKGLLGGPPGSGKSTLCTQFPKVYYIDTERGANKKQYTDAIAAGGGVYFGVEDGGGDPDEVLKEIETLSKTKHPYLTTVIDSLTTLYEAKLEEGAQKVGTDYGKHIDFANRWAKRLFRALTVLDTNVICTSHVKDSWDGGQLKGQAIDGFRKTLYLFDLCLMLERRTTKRFAVVEKSRYAEFPDRDSFELSYAEIERRWGAAKLNREAVPSKMATPEQVVMLERKTKALNIPPDEIQKWLDKADAESFAEFTEEQMLKALSYCDKKIAEAGLSIVVADSVKTQDQGETK